jgi:protease-4
MNFLRNLLASILGTLFAFGILFFMFMIFVTLANLDETVTIRPDSVLELELAEPISEYTGNDPSDPFAGLFEQSMGLDEVLHAIQVAKQDEQIRGISINGNFINAGVSQIRAIRNALLDFKTSGKFVYAYGDFYLQKDYYLASVADSVYLNPVGAVDFRGLSAEVLFFNELQEKSGIRMEVVRHGKYKSAVEPFIADEMSASNREQIRDLITSLWETVSSDISETRDISKEDLNQIADTLGGRTPEYALGTGLVDGILYADEYNELIKESVGTGENEDQSYILLQDYLRIAKDQKIHKGKDKIAVIFAQGEMLYGEGGPNYIGQDVINEALQKARDDEDVQAIVLRINSPGGSALTSELIWREIERTKKEKPVVVSMSDVTASAGYYIASGADWIFAEPTTITGSIGVFMIAPNLHGFADKIGINAEQVTTHSNSLEYSLFEPPNDNFIKVVSEGIEDTYQRFLKRVSDGRNISIARADSLAQGRVWSGSDALRLGLVDEIGGLYEAVAEAASLAGVESYEIRKYPRYKSGFARLMEDLEDSGSARHESLLESELGSEIYGTYRDLRNALKQKGLQARMPFTIHIK